MTTPPTQNQFETLLAELINALAQTAVTVATQDDGAPAATLTAPAE